MPSRFRLAPPGQAKVAQGEMGQREIRLQVKRASERAFGGLVLSSLLADRGEQIIVRRIQLVGGDRLFTPLARFGAPAFIAASAGLAPQRFALIVPARVPVFGLRPLRATSIVRRFRREGRSGQAEGRSL